MARFGKINQKRFDNTEGTDGQILKRLAGIYTPSNESGGASATNRSQQLVIASRSLIAADAGKHLYSTNATPFDLTIPNATFATNDEIELAVDGAGAINLIPGSGFTINGSSATVTALSGTAGFLKFRSSSAAQWYGGSLPATPKDWLIYSNNNLRSFQSAGTNQVVDSFIIPGGTVKPGGHIEFEIIDKGTGTGSKSTIINIGSLNILTITRTTANFVYVGKKIMNRANTTVVATGSTNFGYATNLTAINTAALDWTTNQTFQYLATVVTAAQGIDAHSIYVRVVNP
jgi:hypothetical protein